MIRWLRWLLGGPAVTVTVRLRGLHGCIGPYHVRDGDRIDFDDDRGWAGTLVFGTPKRSVPWAVDVTGEPLLRADPK